MSVLSVLHKNANNFKKIKNKNKKKMNKRNEKG